MTTARSRWLSSPHLARSEGGARAVAAIKSLPAEAQRDVLAFGDRLVESSPAVAQAYALAAAPARTALGADAFAAWAERGLAIAGPPLDNREAGTAYFRLDPVRLAAAGERLLACWIEKTALVERASRRLAALFLETSGRVLADLGAGAEPRLTAWAESGVRLATATGWRGEFLATAYFGAARVLAVLAADEIGPWVELGTAVQVGREVSQHFFQALPEGFERLSHTERRRLLGLASEAARVAPRAAAELFARLPAALAPLEPGVRASLLTIVERSARQVEEWLRLVPLLGAIVRSLPERERRPLVDAAASIAGRFPDCVPALLRSLPRAREETDADGVAAWIGRGARIAEDNREAGRPYFALESRTSVHFLRETSSAVRLEEVQGVLRSYGRMLGGAALEIRSADGASLRPFLDADCVGGASFALPEKVDLFEAWEDNFALAKLMTAGGVGRVLHGTFDLSLARVAARLPRPLAEVLTSSISGDTLAGFFEVVPEADPLVTLFAACEGARIDARLRARYRGFAADLSRIAGRLAALGSGRDPSPDLVLFLLGAGWRPERLATAELPAELLAEVAKVLLAPAATVDDALAAAILLRERLGDSLAVSGLGAMTSYEDLLFERITADADFDANPEGGEEPGRERAGATEVLDIDPARVEEGEEEGKGRALSPEELKRLLQAGAILRVGRDQDAEDSAGIFARGITLSGPEGDGSVDPGEVESARRARRAHAEVAGFEYDEWDFQVRDYRRRWCRLEETALGGDAGEFFHQTLLRYADLLPEVRRQFQRIRPERLQKIRGLEDGEDFDLNAVVEARVERRAGRSPSPRLYVARRREERDVATLFLLDMSASTDEPLVPPPRPAAAEDGEVVPRHPARKPRRIIDVTKEALVIMAEALEELGDRYAIYGFSGQGRANVEFYRVKHFNEGLTAAARGRIGGIEPKRSTRMGTALRHAITKLANVAARSRHILLLSDGFPQDFDYGNDRRSNVYGIQDTMMALHECQAAGITPFCITVDKTGHDYLRQMCDASRYLVIEDVAALPMELPKIYERWVRA